MTSRRNIPLILLLVILSMFVAACGSDDAGSAGDADSGSSCPEGEQQVTEGLTYVEVECGDGEEAETGDTVTVHYTGTLEDGTEFDSSVGRDPFSFTIGGGGVIEGWEQGVPGMRVGGTRELTIAPELAYGESGAGGVIPPGATLTFEIELIEITEPGTP